MVRDAGVWIDAVSGNEVLGSLSYLCSDEPVHWDGQRMDGAPSSVVGPMLHP